jgi:hypothetical protein
MAITEIEMEVINTVVEHFLQLRQGLTSTQLLRKFRNDQALNILSRPWFFRLSQSGYVPLPFAFESCGNAPLIQARQATAIVLQILQDLDKTNPQKEGSFTYQEFLQHTATMLNPTPDNYILTLGLYLAQYFQIFYQISGHMEKPGDQTSFKFNQRIITINPAQAWDDHITSIRSGPAGPGPKMVLSGRLLRVFLCHSKEDKPQVRKLYARLQQDGFVPWLDEEDLIPGQDWREEISKAVRACEVVVVCLSKSSVTREGYVQKEIGLALDVADEKPEGTIFIIPVRLEEVDAPGRLSRWHWVNLFEEDGHQRLRRALTVRAGTLGIAEASCAVPNAPASKPAPPNTSIAKRVGQREMMLALISKHGIDQDTVCREYAQAEQRGEVERKKNPHNISPEQYAQMLWRDGIRKGWIPK